MRKPVTSLVRLQSHTAGIEQDFEDHLVLLLM